MPLFNLDTDQLVKLLLPQHMRTSFNRLFINALVKPIKLLYLALIDYRATVLYDMDHNSQVCRMEGALNDTFPNTDRQIKIEDAPSTDPLYIRIVAENQPRYIYSTTETQHTYIHTPAEIWTGATDFYVQVPAALTYDAARMNSLIKKYKLPGRTYEITTI